MNTLEKLNKGFEKLAEDGVLPTATVLRAPKVDNVRALRDRLQALQDREESDVSDSYWSAFFGGPKPSQEVQPNSRPMTSAGLRERMEALQRNSNSDAAKAFMGSIGDNMISKTPTVGILPALVGNYFNNYGNKPIPRVPAARRRIGKRLPVKASPTANQGVRPNPNPVAAYRAPFNSFASALAR